MQSGIPPVTEPTGAAYAPLAPLLHAVISERLDEARRRLAGLEREDLINRFRTAFWSGKRVTAFLMANELTARNIPPAFWHDCRSSTDFSTNQKFDLFLGDLCWIRRQYPDHVKSIRYGRYRALFGHYEPSFHNAAEFIFYAGQRPAWKIVASMSLSDRMQIDCRWLQSAPIKKRNAIIQAQRDQVFNALRENLKGVRRTKKFTDDDAHTALIRRHALWLCAQMTGGGAADTARRYGQLTGQEITPDVVARQLQIVQKTLTENRATASNKK